MDHYSSSYTEESGTSTEEEENWWLTQLWTLVAGLTCGMLAHVIVKHFSSSRAAASTGPGRSLASLIPTMDNKMVLAVRTDLGMTKGKVAAQCAHAAVGCYKKAVKQTPDFLRSWEMFGQTKVAVKVESEEAVRMLQVQAEAKGLVTSVVRDAGRTQVDPGTVTVIGIGPGPTEIVDSVTGHLKLY